MYILPEYRIQGIKINIKIWKPDRPDSVTLVFDANLGLKSSYKLTIGAHKNKMMLLYYKSEEEGILLLL